MEIRWLLFLAVSFATPSLVRGADPLDTIREAFRASSKGLHSGIGNGNSRFEPNAKVDTDLFTEASLRMPAGSPIVDSRPESKVRFRRSR